MFFSANGQKTEDFSNAKLPTSYSTGTFIGTDSVVWNYVNARGGQTTTANANAAISLNKAANACLFSDTLRYGLVSLQFKYEQELTTNCNASVWINDSCVGQLITSGEADITKFFTLDNLPFKGNVVFTIRQNAASSGQLTIDDIYMEFAEKPLLPFVIQNIEHANGMSTLQFSHRIAHATVSVQPTSVIQQTRVTDSCIYVYYSPNVCGSYNIHVTSITDTLGRICADTSFRIDFAYIPQRHELLITEIMADPSPTVGLPDFEYIELYNASLCDINLAQLRLVVGIDGYELGNCIVPSGRYVLVVSQKAKQLYGDSIIVCSLPSLPSILNSGQTIAIVCEKQIISSVKYADTWYSTKIKKEGGWALEKIDIHNVSETQDNWKAAQNFMGGTPGYQNSVWAYNSDVKNPCVTYMALQNDTTILCKTNENIDAFILQQSLEFSNEIEILHCLPHNFQLQEFLITLKTPLQKQRVYTCFVTPNLSDFSGNFANEHTFELALFDTVQYINEIIITEFLNNPIPGKSDFVEVYNNSNTYINLAHVLIANKDSVNNDVGTFSLVSDVPLVFAPHTYAVFSSNADYYSQFSDCNLQAQFIQIASMPSFPDVQGTIIIQNIWGTVLDSVSYSEAWHSSALHDVEGVSLERLQYSKPTQLSTNWQSASTLHGGMSPGCPNTQQASSEPILFTIKHTCITPNNDGDNDMLRILYTSGEAEKTLHMYIFSFDGNLVQHTINNTLMGSFGEVTWDGTNNTFEIVPPGLYVVLLEVLEQGKRVYSKKFSCTVMY